MFLAACATTGPQSPSPAIAKASTFFNGRDSILIWVPSTTTHTLSGNLASALIGYVGLESPAVRSVHQAIARANDSDVRVTISGPDSKFTAKVIIASLNNAPNKLARLQPAFVGSSDDAGDIRREVESRGGQFFFANDDS